MIQSKGWFLFPAGRRPRHQLIGEAIRTRDLQGCSWIQYSSLQNRGLDAGLCEALRNNSVEMQNKFDVTPTVKSRVLYPSERALYPSLETMWQPNAVQVLKESFSKIDPDRISLHPRMSHLIFWDLPGIF
eukprot:SAG31_NODE_1868_length_7028_cov_4.100303_4_plen_130_part_00